MSRLAVLIGFVIVFASIYATFAMGTQLALIGVVFVLLGLFIELRKIAKALTKAQ